MSALARFTISDRAEWDELGLGDFDGVSNGRVLYEGAALNGRASGGLYCGIRLSLVSIDGSGRANRSSDVFGRSSLVLFASPWPSVVSF